MLGDYLPGVDDANSDANYTGDYTPTDPLTLDYYRQKARDFQDTLNAVDQTAQALQAALAAGVDDQTASDLQAMLDDYNSRKGTFVTTAKAINLAADAVNAVGGRFPVLSIPTGLGMPILLPVAAIAAFATAAVLISWGVTWIKGANQRLHDQQLLDNITDPDQKAQVASAIAQSDAAVAQAEASSGLLGSIFGGSGSSLITLALLGVGGWFLYKTFFSGKGGN
jgi:hypothetical protein